MIRVINTELYKIFRRPRTYISFAIIAAIALLIELAMYADGESFTGFLMQSVSDSFSIQGKLVNGYLVTYIILQMLLIHVPLLVALVAADALAGEANLGTLRLLLTKPVSRTRLVLAKFFASVIYSFLLLVWLAVVGLSLSLLLFGEGDMINMKSDMIIILFRDDIFWRYMAAFGFAALAMMTVASLSLLLSVFADNSIGPIISTMGIIILLTIVSNLGLPSFAAVKPYMLTTHMIGWKGFFDDPVPYRSVLRSCLFLLGYSAVFTGTAVYLFNRKDITS